MNSKKIVFFGADERGRWAADYAYENRIEIDCFIDNDPTKWGRIYNGLKIYSPEHLLEHNQAVEIIITTYPVYATHIISQLEKIGFRYGKNIFMCIDKLDTKKILNERFVKWRPICKGGTGNQKYYVETQKGNRWFLQFADITQYKRAKKQFELMRKIAMSGIATPLPVEFNSIHNGGYLLFEWSDGEDLKDVLPYVSEEKQYTLGIAAGNTMLNIHATPISNAPEKWELRSYEKVDNLQQYQKCGLPFTKVEETLIRYIEQNKQLIDQKSYCFLQGDYHLGNLMLENNKVKIVDFDGFRIGSHWSDFSRIVWHAHDYPHFFTGLIHGYFKGEPSQKSWKMIALYISLDAINISLNVSFLHQKNIIKKRLNRNAEIIQQFNNMQSIVPSWYLADLYTT